MASTTEGAALDRVARLLTAILVLLVLLVAGMGTGAVLGFLEYRKVRQTVDAEKPKEIATQLAQRQERLATYLRQRAEQAERDTAKLQKRRDELSEIKKGPLQMAAQAMLFIQLMSDQLALVERQLTEVELAAATGLQPLPVQSEKLGVGGSGDGPRR